MARVNISLPDMIYRQAKDAELNISGLARKAIVQELDDRAKLASAYEYLDELERELGPIDPRDQARADALVRSVVDGAEDARQSA